MSDWKNLCDYKPMAGEFIEVIGKLVSPPQYDDFDFPERKNKARGIGFQVRFYLSEFDYDVLDKSYCYYEMVSPIQYRKITDYKIIKEYKPLPKFDWSYC